jgi:hypothetical protein
MLDKSTYELYTVYEIGKKDSFDTYWRFEGKKQHARR